MSSSSQAKELEAFVEKLGMFFGQESHMPRSVGRILAFLSVCQPMHQSADQIAASLQLSSGAVSIAVNALTQVGLLRRVTFPGDRHYYYQCDPDGWRQATLDSLRAVSRGAVIAKEGLKISKDNPRLQAMHAMYVTLGKEVDTIIDRLEQLPQHHIDQDV